MRLYNPANGSEYVTDSDEEFHVKNFLDAGWQPAPEPEQRPGYEPDPVRYAPVSDDQAGEDDAAPAKAKRASKAADSSDKTD